MEADTATAADAWWQPPLRAAFGGRDVILVGAVPAAWTDHVRHLAQAGAGRMLVVATDGPGVGPAPDVETHVIDVPDELGMMERIRRSNRVIADPPADIRKTVDAFDPDHAAVVIGSFLNESPVFGDRQVFASRRADWPPATLDSVALVAGRLAEFGVPDEAPARLHGDLWAGNRLTDTRGRSWLIDPAAHGGHREFDLAMMRLFGGFDRECFDAYDAAFPLAEGWQRRVPVHQLAPLLVHAIEFGGGYGDGVARAARVALSLL
jgi:hypothetical protein